MLGAILGDIVGSPYEFDHNNYNHKDFPLLSEKSHFTDDTVKMCIRDRIFTGDVEKDVVPTAAPVRRQALPYPLRPVSYTHLERSHNRW